MNRDATSFYSILWLLIRDSNRKTPDWIDYILFSHFNLRKRSILKDKSKQKLTELKMISFKHDNARNNAFWNFNFYTSVFCEVVYCYRVFVLLIQKSDNFLWGCWSIPTLFTRKVGGGVNFMNRKSPFREHFRSRLRNMKNTLIAFIRNLFDEYISIFSPLYTKFLNFWNLSYQLYRK